MTQESTEVTPGNATPDGAALAGGATEVDYVAMLDGVPDEVLQKHSRFNGYAGRLAQRMAEQERAQIVREQYEKARADKEQEMLKLAEENPFEFSQRYLRDKSEEKIKQELGSVRQQAQSALFDRVARGYSEMPEWGQLTPEDFQKIQSRVVGKSDEELVAAFNVAAMDAVTEVRARARAERDLKDRISVERQAWEQEMQARRLRGEFPPDMSLPVSANGQSDVYAIKNMSDREFQDFYERNLKR